MFDSFIEKRVSMAGERCESSHEADSSSRYSFYKQHINTSLLQHTLKAPILAKSIPTNDTQFSPKRYSGRYSFLHPTAFPGIF